MNYLKVKILSDIISGMTRRDDVMYFFSSRDGLELLKTSS